MYTGSGSPYRCDSVSSPSPSSQIAPVRGPPERALCHPDALQLSFRTPTGPSPRSSKTQMPSGPRPCLDRSHPRGSPLRKAQHAGRPVEHTDTRPAVSRLGPPRRRPRPQSKTVTVAELQNFPSADTPSVIRREAGQGHGAARAESPATFIRPGGSSRRDRPLARRRTGPPRTAASTDDTISPNKSAVGSRDDRSLRQRPGTSVEDNVQTRSMLRFQNRCCQTTGQKNSGV